MVEPLFLTAVHIYQYCAGQPVSRISYNANDNEKYRWKTLFSQADRGCSKLDEEQALTEREDAIFNPPLSEIFCSCGAIRIHFKDSFKNLIRGVRVVGIDPKKVNGGTAKQDKIWVDSFRSLSTDVHSNEMVKLHFPLKIGEDEIVDSVTHCHKFLLVNRMNNCQPLVEGKFDEFSFSSLLKDLLMEFIYSGSFGLSEEMFEEGLKPEQLLTDLIFVSKLLDIDVLHLCLKKWMDCLSQYEYSHFPIPLFNQFISGILYQDFKRCMKQLFNDTCVSNQGFDSYTNPDLKISLVNDKKELVGVVYAHSSILRARSTYFKVSHEDEFLTLKTVFNWDSITHANKLQSNRCEIILGDVDYNIFLLLVKFMYNGELDSNDINVVNSLPLYISQCQYLLDISETLDIIKRHLDISSICEIVNLAYEFSLADLTTSCEKFLRQGSRDQVFVKNLKDFVQNDCKGKSIALEESHLFLTLQRIDPLWDVLFQYEGVRYKKEWVTPIHDTRQSINRFAPNWKDTLHYIELKLTEPMFITSIEVSEAPNVTFFSCIHGKTEVLKEILFQSPETMSKGKIKIDGLKSSKRPYQYLILEIEKSKHELFPIANVKISGFVLPRRAFFIENNKATF